MIMSLVYAHLGLHAHYSWDHILLHIAMTLFWVSVLLVGYAMVKKDVRKRVVSVINSTLKRKT